MINLFQIGRITAALDMPDDMPYPETLKPFAIAEAVPTLSFRLEFTDNPETIEQMFLAEHPGGNTYQRANLRVTAADGLECRVLYFEGSPQPYAAYVEEGEGKFRVYFDSAVKPLLTTETIFLSALSLEKAMIQTDCMILHAAYLYHNGEAILFTAPSGTGKSTQAGLWEQYRGSRTVNGDKALLMEQEHIWQACGWPVCGSSGICFNEQYPIRAVVLLRQAKENSIRRLNLSEAVKKMFAQITVNMWNTSYQMRVMDLLLSLAASVPVFELSCDISENAVACLEGVL